MDLHLNGLGEIQAENAHDGFSVYSIPAGNQVNVKLIMADSVDKLLDIVDCAPLNTGEFL